MVSKIIQRLILVSVLFASLPTLASPRCGNQFSDEARISKHRHLEKPADRVHPRLAKAIQKDPLSYTKKDDPDSVPGIFSKIIAFFGRFYVGRKVSQVFNTEVRGLDPIEAKGRKGIFFLMSHPSLSDPLVVWNTLRKKFNVRMIMARDTAPIPFAQALLRASGVILLDRSDPNDVHRVKQIILEGLKRGENFCLYPGGRLKRQSAEDLGPAFMAHDIVKDAPKGTRVVLGRTTGLWGSPLSFGATGESPNAIDFKLYFKAQRELGKNFRPTPVLIEFTEPGAKLPKSAGVDPFNRYIESWYHERPDPNTVVPFDKRKKIIVRKEDPKVESEETSHSSDASNVPAQVRRDAIDIIKEIAKMDIDPKDNERLRDLGIDSLSMVELFMMVEEKFNVVISDGEAPKIKTVGNLLLVADRKIDASKDSGFKEVDGRWSKERPEEAALLPFKNIERPIESLEELQRSLKGQNVLKIIMRRARENPDRVIIADQTSGTITYRELVQKVFAIRAYVKARTKGQYVGLMLPASVGATLAYLGVMSAGKVPVQVNWTTGAKVAKAALSDPKLNVQDILTSELLEKKINADAKEKGEKDLSLEILSSHFRFHHMESIKRGPPNAVIVGSALAGKISFGLLSRFLSLQKVADTAVVIFTSGTEGVPKAVGISHQSQLIQMNEVLKEVELKRSDSIIGFIPPFHSFGSTVAVTLPLTLGIPIVYTPDPTASKTIVKTIRAYEPTVVVGVPAFLEAIAREAGGSPLPSVRIAVTGGAKATEQTYSTVGQAMRNAVILEGYGITECGPIVSMNTLSFPHAGTIGNVLRSYQYLLVDAEMNPTRGEGTLLVTGPTIMNRYLTGTSDPFVTIDGKRYYNTKDYVRERRDLGERTLEFLHRNSRSFKRGKDGEMVSLDMIESTLRSEFQAPDALDSFAVVATTPKEGQAERKIVVYTTLSEAELTKEQMNRHVTEELAPIFAVDGVIRIEEIPIAGTGKANHKKLTFELEEHGY